MRRLLVVGLLVAGIGCGGVANTGEPAGAHDSRGDGGRGSLADSELGGNAGASTGGGSVGASTAGGSVFTSTGGAPALAGNAAGAAADAGSDDVGVGGYIGGAGVADFGDCVSDLSGGPGDAISVHGHAGVLGDVDFTIAGYNSAGSGSDHGVSLSTSGQVQKGGPSGINEVTLTAWTLPDIAVEGRIYPRDPSQLEFRLEVDSPMTTVSCDATGTGSFAFSRLSDHSTDGVYQLDCPAADVRVYGCFHYVH